MSATWDPSYDNTVASNLLTGATFTLELLTTGGAELSDPNYVRQAVTLASAAGATANDTVVSNTAAVTFPAFAASVTVTGYGLLRSDASGVVVLLTTTFVAPMGVPAGGVLTLPVGAISLTVATS